MIRIFVLLLGLAWSAPAFAQTAPVHASYAGYAKGLNVLDLDADFTVGVRNYAMHVVYHTAGAVGLLIRGQQDATVTGQFVGGRASPLRFYSFGHFRGRPHVTLIDYHDDSPELRQLLPASADDDPREPVPDTRQAHTVDSLSAIADLIRRVAATGRCEDQITTYDGRRLAAFEARTAGSEVLEPTSRSSFSGTALRCDIVARQLGGFRTDLDPDEVRRIRPGRVWLAAVAPGGPIVPVRLMFETDLLGEMTMYLVDSAEQ